MYQWRSMQEMKKQGHASKQEIRPQEGQSFYAPGRIGQTVPFLRCVPALSTPSARALLLPTQPQMIAELSFGESNSVSLVVTTCLLSVVLMGPSSLFKTLASENCVPWTSNLNM